MITPKNALRLSEEYQKGQFRHRVEHMEQVIDRQLAKTSCLGITTVAIYDKEQIGISKPEIDEIIKQYSPHWSVRYQGSSRTDCVDGENLSYGLTTHIFFFNPLQTQPIQTT
jgi:hypothetical protein